MEKPLTIQQIANVTGLSVHTLRYYEKMGLLEGVARNEHGYRQYSEADLSWIDFLLCLRDLGMTISEMKYYSDLRSQGASTLNPRRQLLEAHHEKVTTQIKALEQNLHKIKEKIILYKRLEEEAGKQADKKSGVGRLSITLTVKKITPEELYEKMKNQEQVTLLDVRAEEKYNDYHIEGATVESRNINKTEIFDLVEKGESSIAALPKEKEIIVTCTTGNSAAKCAAVLSERQYKVVVLEGGITAWKNYIASK
ncbi:rhodanese-like domain-containing protein [Brevibacillus migulae]|uniref:rhodanese-like domain-containing protein n=1 Tax=Brevibacillus migulae TaxID=1644114 RepID=UPI002E25AF4A